MHKLHQLFSKQDGMSSLLKKFVLKHTFENVSKMPENVMVYNEQEEHFGVPWKVFIYRKDGHLAFFLKCCKELDGAKWSVQTDFKLKLAASGPMKTDIGHTFGNADGNTKFTAKGAPKFVKWEEMKEKYMDGDKLTVEAHVWIVNMTGFYAENSMTFDDQSMKELSDMQIIIGGKKFFVSKQLLAFQSSYFKKVFIESNKNQEKFEFQQLDAADFQKYLETLYGQSNVIDDANVEAILLIATELSTPSVIWKCEQFLMEKSQKSVAKKLQMASSCNSERLKIHCVSTAFKQAPPARPAPPSPSSLYPKLPSSSNASTTNQVTPKNTSEPKYCSDLEKIDDVIEYKSGMVTVDTASDVLNVSTQSGLKCTWSGTLLHEKGPIDFTWKFEWDQLNRQGVDGFAGEILCKLGNVKEFFQLEVDLKNPTQIVEHVIVNDRSAVDASFEYYLIPIHNRSIEKVQVKTEKEVEDVMTDIYPDDVKDVTSDDIFLPSKKNDTILAIDAKLLYVNKAYLSYHSDFFEHLFTHDKDKEQFDIEDVTYEDFALLMNAIYPDRVFPSENSFPKLAKLADRFQMPTVTRQIENSLLKESKLEGPVLMAMADKYGMSRLLEKSIQMMDTAEKAKILKTSPEFYELSLETKATLFERVVDLI